MTDQRTAQLLRRLRGAVRYKKGGTAAVLFRRAVYKEYRAGTFAVMPFMIDLRTYKVRLAGAADDITVELFD